MGSRRALLYVGLGVLAIGFFLIDVLSAPELSVALLQVAVVLLTLFTKGRRSTLVFGGVTTLCVLAGAGVHFTQGTPPLSLANHGLALIGLWTGVGVVSAYKHLLRARRESEARAQSILETTADGIVTIDDDGLIESFNAAAEEIFGYAAEDVLGSPAERLLAPSARDHFDQFLPSSAPSGQPADSSPRELDAQRPDGTTVPVEVSVRTVDAGEAPLSTCVVRDITKRKQNERRLHIQYRVAQILTGSDSLPDATPQLLEVICKELGLDWGELWVPNADRTRLQNADIVRMGPSDRAEFGSVTHQTTFAPGVGLPGVVWESQHPEWISDVQEDDLLVRAQAATKANLRTGFAFPIALESTVFGVMVFFSSDVLEPDAALLEMFSVLGNQIGQFTDRRRTEEALQRTTGQLRRAQEVAGMGSWEYDLKSGALTWSDQMYRLLGLDPEMATPQLDRALDYVFPEDRQYFESYLQRVPDEDTSFSLEHRMRREDGSTRWVFTQADVDVETGCVVGTTLDMTELKQTKEALEESEARAQAILDTTVDGIITIDGQGAIESFNSAAEDIFGYEAVEVIGKNVKVLMPSPYRDEHDDYLQNYHETGRRKIIGIGREVTGRRKDGTTFPMELAVSEVELGNRTLFTGIVRDISERRRLEQEILSVSEQERRRIGQDLHDGLGQMLTGIGLLSQDVTRQLEEEGHERAGDMAEITEHVKEADQYARDLSHGLIPVDVEAGGLTEALRRLAENAERLFDVDCTFDHVGYTRIENSAAANHLYRIAQEAVSNAAHHGEAPNVKIRLASGEERHRLQVRDDGAGFDPDATDDSGMGIHIMNYRARMLGGTLDVSSAPEEGTTVTCTVPQTAPALSETPATGSGRAHPTSS